MPPTMPRQSLRQVCALIDHIQTRFHEGHRQALPELLALAATVEARGIGNGLVDALRTLGNDLEQHMFKEEMRLFPMMEQGGNTLIRSLIDDLHREHVVHEQAMGRLRTRLRDVAQTHRTDRALQALCQGVGDLANDLALHISAEDKELFPLFSGMVTLDTTPRD